MDHGRLHRLEMTKPVQKIQFLIEEALKPRSSIKVEKKDKRGASATDVVLHRGRVSGSGRLALGVDDQTPSATDEGCGCGC